MPRKTLTPYNYAFNDPIAWNDPSGADPDDGALTGSYVNRRTASPGDGPSQFVWDASEQFGFWHNYGQVVSGAGLDWQKYSGRSSLAFGGWNAGLGRADWSGSTGSDSYRSEQSYARANNGTEWGGKFSDKEGNPINADGWGNIEIECIACGEEAFRIHDGNRTIVYYHNTYSLVEQNTGLNDGLNALATSLRNLADHDAEEAFFNKYWSKIPGYKKNVVSGDISGQKRFPGGTELAGYNLPANLHGWIKDGKDGVELYLNLVGDTDATITNYWHTNNLVTTSGDIRFKNGPAILLRAGEVDILMATFNSVANMNAFRSKYYTQRYNRRFESFKRAYKNYIGN